MVKDYKKQLKETGVTTMGKHGYGTAIHVAGDLTDADSLTEAVKKYAERATQEEERMAQMEENFEGNFAMMSMQRLPQNTYYQQPPPTPNN